MPGLQTHLFKKGKKESLSQQGFDALLRADWKKIPWHQNVEKIFWYASHCSPPVTKNPESEDLNSDPACHSRARRLWAKCVKKMLIHLSQGAVGSVESRIVKLWPHNTCYFLFLFQSFLFSSLVSVFFLPVSYPTGPEGLDRTKTLNLGSPEIQREGNFRQLCQHQTFSALKSTLGTYTSPRTALHVLLWTLPLNSCALAEGLLRASERWLMLGKISNWSWG